MEMIDKVKKYLLCHEQINIYKKNESGSEYFRVGNSIIRVSDHVATSRNDPDTLNIVVCGDNFIVMFGNKIINVNDYNEFKVFLKYHIKMCDCFKDLINKGLGRKSKDYISKQQKPQPVPTPTSDAIAGEVMKEIVVIDGATLGPAEPGEYVFQKQNFCKGSLIGITDKQLQYLEGKSMISHASALRYIKRLKSRNQ